jgi:hypothetical protein
VQYFIAQHQAEKNAPVDVRTAANLIMQMAYQVGGRQGRQAGAPAPDGPSTLDLPPARRLREPPAGRLPVAGGRGADRAHARAHALRPALPCAARRTRTTCRLG